MLDGGFKTVHHGSFECHECVCQQVKCGHYAFASCLGFKALMKGTIFADVFATIQIFFFFKLPTPFKMTPFHIMTLSQHHRIFCKWDTAK